MEIENLKTVIPQSEIKNLNQAKENHQTTSTNFKLYYILVAFLAIFTGFWLSRFFPSQSNEQAMLSSSSKNKPVSAGHIIKSEDLKVGVIYGDSAKTFTDSAVGTIIEGSINGVGTHILEREGGKSQRVSLISSTLDLDLFIGKKVDVKGETNASNKTSWLLDVGSIKILE